MLQYREEVILTKEECNWIKDTFLNDDWEHSDNVPMVAVPDWGGDAVKIRGGKAMSVWEQWIREDHPERPKLIKLLNERLVNFGIDNWPGTFNVLKYSEGDFMKKHKDTGRGVASYAHLSVSIQLSDSDEYEGGELIVDGTEAGRDIGTIIAFNSLKYHEIKPVTSGNRLVMVIFLKVEHMKPYSKTVI